MQSFPSELDSSELQFARYLACPHGHLVHPLKEHKTFYIQAPKFNQTPHGWGTDDLTEAAWVDSIDTQRFTKAVFTGWPQGHTWKWKPRR